MAVEGKSVLDGDINVSWLVELSPLDVHGTVCDRGETIMGRIAVTMVAVADPPRLKKSLASSN
jgi:hypothetical protein